MIFVTGGYKSGKRQFVIDNLNYSKDDFTDNLEDDSSTVIFNLQDINILDYDKALTKLLTKQVIICNELGCGVVPIEKELRQKRDLIGKLCIDIASKADEVYRVYAGIGVKIK